MLARRIATQDDEPAMRAAMQRAINECLKPYLPAEGVAAWFEVMGLDSQLIADGRVLRGDRGRRYRRLRRLEPPRAPRVSPASNSPPPWRARRFIARAAIKPSSRSSRAPAWGSMFR